MPGRPYNEELATLVIDELARGAQVYEACERHGLDGPSFQYWRRRDPALHARVLAAFETWEKHKPKRKKRDMSISRAPSEAQIIHALENAPRVVGREHWFTLRPDGARRCAHCEAVQAVGRYGRCDPVSGIYYTGKEAEKKRRSF